jgi:hypothetical protein
MICADYSKRNCLVACTEHEVNSGRCSCVNGDVVVKLTPRAEAVLQEWDKDCGEGRVKTGYIMPEKQTFNSVCPFCESSQVGVDMCQVGWFTFANNKPCPNCGRVRYIKSFDLQNNTK